MTARVSPHNPLKSLFEPRTASTSLLAVPAGNAGGSFPMLAVFFGGGESTVGEVCVFSGVVGDTTTVGEVSVFSGVATGWGVDASEVIAGVGVTSGLGVLGIAGVDALSELLGVLSEEMVGMGDSVTGFVSVFSCVLVVGLVTLLLAWG